MPSEVIAFAVFRLRAAQRLLEKDGAGSSWAVGRSTFSSRWSNVRPEVVSKRELLARVWPGLVLGFMRGSLRFHIRCPSQVSGRAIGRALSLNQCRGSRYCFAAPVLRSGAKPPPAESLRAEHRHNAEAMGAQAGAIAHDFNNIVYAILGYASSRRTPHLRPTQCGAMWTTS